MGHPGRQHADGLHLVGLDHLLLHNQLAGDILANREEAYYLPFLVEDGRDDLALPVQVAVFLPIPDISRPGISEGNCFP